MLLCKFGKKAAKPTLYESLNADPKSQDDRAKSLLKIEYLKAKIASPEAQGSAFLSVFRQASLTVEAAVVLPLFILFFTAVFSLFSIMSLQIRIQEVLSEAAGELAAYYYAADKLSSEEDAGKRSLVANIGIDVAGYLASETLVKQQVTTRMPEMADHPMLKDGVDGLQFIGSGFREDTQEIVVCTTYEVRIPYVSEKVARLTLSQEAVQRAWTGKRLNDEAVEKIVYITETGTVYHTSLSCTHLKLSIEAVKLSAIERKRNEGGAKYYECERCDDRPHGEEVYITVYGNRYHYDRNCSGLKRTVNSVPISQVGDKKECSRCKAREKGGS